MTMEEIKAFEQAHPEYKPLLWPILTELDAIAREEFSKAFKAINERAAAIQAEHIEKYHVPENDVKEINAAWNAFMKQIDSDFKKGMKDFLENNGK